ncbi:MAG: RibD family protein [Pseudomonadota bacterium]
MHSVDVTPRVWDRLLSVRHGEDCLCGQDWTTGEQRAISLYGPLAQPSSETCVIAQIGQSLDGRIATPSGDAKDISGSDGLAHLHRLRAMSDAVVIGVETALHDNPRLTVRLARGDNPVRVVIDPNGRMPNDTGLLQDREARCIVIQSVDKPRPDHVEVIRLPRDKWISPSHIIAALKRHGLQRILIEGGGVTIARFLEAKLLNRLHVAVAPLLIGAGPQGLTTSPVARLDDALRPVTEVYALGSDVLFDCSFGSAHGNCAYPLPCRTARHVVPMEALKSGHAW